MTYDQCCEEVFGCFVGIVRPLPGLDGRELESFDPVIVNSSDDVSRDLLSERTDRWTSDVHCCCYYCGTGSCWWSDWSDRRGRVEDWEGEEGLPQEGGTVGLLLDLDDGTLTAYMNGRRLGVMKDGLSGEYCWYTSVCNRITVSIERGVLP